MPSSITYIRLDNSNDPVFDPQAALVDLAAVTQAIKTKILLFEGEWWENRNEGTPMFQEILGQVATPNGQQVMSMALSARISKVPYVSAVQNITVGFDKITRKFTFVAVAQTSFGTATVSVSP